MLKEWDTIIQKLAKYKDKIPKEDLIVFLNKFMPQALKKLIAKGRELEEDGQLEEEIEENSDESSDLEDYEREEE